MHRFFLLQHGERPAREEASEPLWAPGAELALSETDSVHVARVLRLRPGQRVIVSDGRGFDYGAELVKVSPQGAIVRLGPPSPSKAEPRLFVTLLQGIAKGSKMDFIVQKAVEIGVRRIIPVDAERTVVRLNKDKADARVERWRRIAYEAAKQAGRARLPTVEPVASWQDVWRRDDLGAVVVPWEDEMGSGLLETMRALSQGVAASGTDIPRITVAIGPEGGYSQEEIEAAVRSGARSVSLGPRILRTETAAIVACSLVLAAFGELGSPRGA